MSKDTPEANQDPIYAILSKAPKFLEEYKRLEALWYKTEDDSYRTFLLKRLASMMVTSGFTAEEIDAAVSQMFPEDEIIKARTWSIVLTTALKQKPESDPHAAAMKEIIDHSVTRVIECHLNCIEKKDKEGFQRTTIEFKERKRVNELNTLYYSIRLNLIHAENILKLLRTDKWEYLDLLDLAHTIITHLTFLSETINAETIEIGKWKNTFRILVAYMRKAMIEEIIADMAESDDLLEMADLLDLDEDDPMLEPEILLDLARKMREASNTEES